MRFERSARRENRSRPLEPFDRSSQLRPMRTKTRTKTRTTKTTTTTRTTTRTKTSLAINRRPRSRSTRICATTDASMAGIAKIQGFPQRRCFLAGSGSPCNQRHSRTGCRKRSPAEIHGRSMCSSSCSWPEQHPALRPCRPTPARPLPSESCSANSTPPRMICAPFAGPRIESSTIFDPTTRANCVSATTNIATKSTPSRETSRSVSQRATTSGRLVCNALSAIWRIASPSNGSSRISRSTCRACRSTPESLSSMVRTNVSSKSARSGGSCTTRARIKFASCARTWRIATSHTRSNCSTRKPRSKKPPRALPQHHLDQRRRKASPAC